MFCKSCGTMLLPRSTPFGKWMSCPEGHPQPEVVREAKISTQINSQQMKPVTVGDGINILAVHDHKCKKCGHDKAEMREIGPSYGDEDSVVRMKCGNCGVVEQMEGKTT